MDIQFIFCCLVIPGWFCRFKSNFNLFNRVKISDFEIRILCSIERRPPHPYGVLPQSHVLWAWILYCYEGMLFYELPRSLQNFIFFWRPVDINSALFTNAATQGFLFLSGFITGSRGIFIGRAFLFYLTIKYTPAWSQLKQTLYARQSEALIMD